LDIDIAKSEFEALVLRVAAQHPDACPEELVPYIAAATPASKRRDFSRLRSSR
jgi:hypothetical protein